MAFTRGKDERKAVIKHWLLCLTDYWPPLTVFLTLFGYFSLFVAVLFVLVGCGVVAPTPTPTAEPTFTATPTSTATATPWVPMPLPTATPTIAISPTPPPVGPVFYVATDGDDRLGDGSVGQPWLTISHAVLAVPDGATILVRPGTYIGEVSLRGQFAEGITIRAEIPYQTQLRHSSTVVTCFFAQGISLEGFDIAHLGEGSEFYLVQIQDQLKAAGAEEPVSRITLRNNILHDSYGQELLKINNGVNHITVEGNIFYNPGARSLHVDLNSAQDVVVQDNLFFTDYPASGRENFYTHDSFIAVRDSNGPTDGILGSRQVQLRRNIFLNWQGNPNSSWLVIGGDSVSYFPAQEILIENNLFWAYQSSLALTLLAVKGSRDVTFQHNTVVGDLPSFAYAMRLNTQENNTANQKIQFFNNIWSDPTQTMGAPDGVSRQRFSLSEPGDTQTFAITNNLYWNGGVSIPTDSSQMVNYQNDQQRLIGDPLLPVRTEIILPIWSATQNQFADGSHTIRELFIKLAQWYGLPAVNSLAIDNAHPDHSPQDDLLGQPRSLKPDVGAMERPTPAALATPTPLISPTETPLPTPTP